MCRPSSNMGTIKIKKLISIIFFIYEIIFSKISSKSCYFNICQNKLLIPLWLTESAEWTNSENRTESNLKWVLILLNSLSQFHFVTTQMINTFIWHLTHHPLTLCCLLPLFLYTRNLLTSLKKSLQIIEKWLKLNSKHWCWWWR